MIRLLVLIDTNIGTRGGGAERHLQVLIENLDYSRFTVHVLELERTAPRPETRIAGATVSHLPTGKVLSVHGFRRMLQILNLMRKGNYDCVLSFFESSDLISIIVSPLAGVDVLLSSRRDMGFRHSTKMRWLYRIMNGRFNRIIAASEAVRQSLLHSGVCDDAVRTIYNGVDMSRFKALDGMSLRRELGVSTDAIILGMVANLVPVKDHSTVIECVRRFHTSGERVHLALAGDGPLRAELERQVAQSGLSGYVHFLGRRDDVPTVLAGVDMMVLSSLTEGLSNALLEAMAAGKAVVATGVGGNAEVVVDGVTGFLVHPKDVSAFYDAIGPLICSAELRLRLGKAGRERVSKYFSLVAMVRGYVSIIEQEIAESRKTLTYHKVS